MESLGKAAYEAYSRKTGGRSLVTGAMLPGWDGLKPDIRVAWDAAAAAAITMSAGLSNLWYVGQLRSGEHPDFVWDFQGVFSSEELANLACRDRTYFVVPVALNEELPHEQIESPGYYPIAQLQHALKESVWLQSHYAELLNQHDGGRRLTFNSADDWLARIAVVEAQNSSADAPSGEQEPGE